MKRANEGTLAWMRAPGRRSALRRRIITAVAAVAMVAAIAPPAALLAADAGSVLSGSNPSPTCIRIARTLITLDEPCTIDITSSAVVVGPQTSGGTFVTTAFGWSAKKDSFSDRILAESPGPVSAHVEWGDGTAPVQLGANFATTAAIAYEANSNRARMGHTYTAAGTYTVTLTARLHLSDTCTGVCPAAAAPAPYYVTAQVQTTVVVGAITPSVSFAAAPPSTVKVGAPVSVALATGTIDPDAWYNVYIGWNDEDEATLLTPTGASGSQTLLPTTYADLTHTYSELGVNRVWARAIECTRSNIVGAPCTEGPWSGTIPIRTVSTFVTVVPSPVPVTISGSRSHGSATSTFAVTATPPTGVTVTTSASCTTVNGGTAIDAGLPAGTYTLDADSCSAVTSSHPDTYPAVTVGGPFTVGPGIPVTVTGGHIWGDLNDQVFAPVVGSASPDSSVTVTGSVVTCTRLVGGLQISSVTAAGTYAIDPTGCTGLTSTDPAYPIHYAGTYTITVRPIPVTVSGTWFSGSAPVLTPDDPYVPFGEIEGTVQSCHVLVVGVSTLVSTSLAAGTYTIDPVAGCTGLNLTSLFASSLSIAYQGSVTVHPRTIAVAVSGAWTYGDDPATLGFVPSPPAGITLSGTGVCTTVDGGTPIAAGLGVGAHTIDPAGCSGLTASDPTFIVRYAGSVTVGAAPLTIRASDATLILGDSVPAITASYDGFVAGDDATDLTTAPTCSTSATDTSPVGSYQSTCTGAVGANYAISYVAGSVTVSNDVKVLFNDASVYKGGSTIPIRLQLTSADGSNLSSPSLILTVVGLDPSPATGPEPTGTFDFVAVRRGEPFYQYDLKTKGYQAGRHVLSFTVTGDPTVHSVEFVIR